MLIKDKLKNGILNVIMSYPNSAGGAAQGIGIEYNNYCMDAIDPMQGVPVLTNLTQLIASLTAIFSALSLNIGTKHSDIANALTDFWLSPPVQFIVSVPPGGSSVVSRVDGTAILAQKLEMIFRDLSGKSFEQKADELATAIDEFTKTVFVVGVLNTVPNPTPYSGYIL